MPKDPQSVVTDYTYTQNRELSWLRFNRRVLEEGADETVPALERLKFIAIFASTSDDGPMKRMPLSSQARANSAFSDRKP